jgi:uncharacterized Zn finger protein
MRDFELTPSCDKCGDKSLKKTFVQFTRGEWIECKCSACGYVWSMKCKDAKPEVEET